MLGSVTAVSGATIAPGFSIGTLVVTNTLTFQSSSTNVMELIISETGAVEHARLTVAPQRMPDMMLLSRAKLWTFGPAMKDGRPVRYRLVLKWEVNP